MGAGGATSQTETFFFRNETSASLCLLVCGTSNISEEVTCSELRLEVPARWNLF